MSLFAIDSCYLQLARDKHLQKGQVSYAYMMLDALVGGSRVPMCPYIMPRVMGASISQSTSQEESLMEEIFVLGVDSGHQMAVGMKGW